VSHLGARVSALLDGRLAPDVEERLWSHVHKCHPCRDLVEREGTVKTRLAAWSMDASTSGPVPEQLRASLLDPTASSGAPWLQAGSARSRGALVLGGGVAGAVGATVVGVLALGVAPAEAPSNERRVPATQLSRPATGPWTEAPRPLRGTSLTPRTERRDGARGTMGR
jgi:anti-sigma factor RsiW